MPVLVYILMAAWLAFAGWVAWKSKAAIDSLPGRYMKTDLAWKIITGKLPAEERRIYARFFLLLFFSLVVLAATILGVMIYTTSQT